MNFDKLYVVVATLFVIMAVGFLCRKMGVIDDMASKKLSKLILMVGQPAMLVYSLAKPDYTPENLKIALIMILLGFVFHAVLALIAYFAALPLKKSPDERKVTEFSFMFANCAFIGFPIFQALIGDIGMFMASFLTISFNILMWTWGLGIFARGRKDIKMTLFKVLVNFGTIPCLVGFGLFLLKNPAIGIEIPTFFTESFMKAAEYLTNLCTPISVLITGALIATQSPKKIFCSWKIYYFNVVKLFVLPLLVACIAKLVMIIFPSPEIKIYAIFCSAAAALPAASSVTMMSETYGLDAGYSSLTVGTSSLLSVAALPLSMMLVQFILAL